MLGVHMRDPLIPLGGSMTDSSTTPARTAGEVSARSYLWCLPGRRSGLAVLIWFCLAGMALASCSTQTVSILNASSQTVLLSGCFIDDGADLRPGESASQAIPAGGKGWKCDAFVQKAGKVTYVGCLVVRPGQDSYRVLHDVDVSIQQIACERS
jgi:hypothetical protein